MNDQTDPIRVTRWIDGEIKDSEINELLEENPSLREECQATREIGELLRREMVAERDVPFPEVFNRQILRRIQEEENGRFWNRSSHFFSWLMGSEWGLPVAASATLLLLLTAGLQVQGSRHFRSKVVHTFTPNPAHLAKTREDAKTGVTVISLQGLAPLPDTAQVMGYFPTKSRQEPAMAATLFYEGEKPRLLLTMNAMGEPRFQNLR